MDKGFPHKPGVPSKLLVNGKCFNSVKQAEFCREQI